MPNLQDVAKKAGVSTATVSKVLSNTPYFTEETRDRVMIAVRELGYMPNLAGRALSSGKTNIVAVVFPYIYDPIFKDPLVMQILEGIEAQCTSEKYNILLSTPRVSAEEIDPHYIQLIQSGYIDGLIAIDNVPINSVAVPAIERNIPTVIIGYTDEQYSVRSDDLGGAKLLMQHILELGHRNIGIITVPQDTNFALNQRMVGIQQVAEEAGMCFTDIPVSYGNYSTSSGVKAAKILLEDHPNLTAIICLNDRMALGAMQQAYQMGRHVPNDLTVVGYDNISAASMALPPLTTVDQHALKLGQVASKMLFSIFEGAMPDSVVVPANLVTRGSSASLNT